MGDKKEFKEALSGKKVPLLTLDQKWHQLFERNGKPIRVQRLEDKIKGLLTKQARANQTYQDLKKLKNTLMDNIVLNMKGTEENQGDTVSAKRLEEDRRLIDEINGKLAACEKELDEIPEKIDELNRTLMLETMDYCYREMKSNAEQIKFLSDWLARTRREIKKNVVIKQNREIMNRQLYAYMHDIFGADVIDIFDLEYHSPGGDFDDDPEEKE